LAGGDRINSFLQLGNTNWASVGRNGASAATVGTFNQIGDSNSARITQTGSGDTVTLLQQVGSNNGGPFGSGGPQNPDQWGTTIIQNGNNNLISESSIVGSNNNKNTTTAPVSYISQVGNNNGINSSIARTYGSNGNFIHVTEQGDWNNFSVLQGLNTSSTGNQATVTQTGNSNAAYVTQYGDDNHVTVTQLGDANVATANFTGDRNGNGTLIGIAAALLTSNANLVEGTIYQDATGASGNTVTYNVSGNDNLFAMAQIGSGNAITGTVSSSNGNQVAVLQTGNNNQTTFSQSGGGNNAISVSQ
jgi:hypothetical protein